MESRENPLTQLCIINLPFVCMFTSFVYYSFFFVLRPNSATSSYHSLDCSKESEDTIRLVMQVNNIFCDI